MKQLITIILLTTFSEATLAHPGGNKLTCKSAAHSGSDQKIEVTLARANGVGWSNPHIEISFNNKPFLLNTPNEMNLYGSTFHNSPLKVITVTADVPYESNTNNGYFNVVAIPDTVKAYDSEGHLIKWSLKNEKDECNDAFGKATFQGIIHGFIRADKTDYNIDPQILDCELEYNPGMAC